jgi:hypothetical protein
MTTREIVLAMLKTQGISNPATKQMRDLYGGAQSCLRNYNGKSVVRVGERLPMRWKLFHKQITSIREMEMPNDLAAQYRQSADECLQRAGTSKDEIDKARWLKMAEEWLTLARQAAQSSTKRK